MKIDLTILFFSVDPVLACGKCKFGDGGMGFLFLFLEIHRRFVETIQLGEAPLKKEENNRKS